MRWLTALVVTIVMAVVFVLGAGQYLASPAQAPMKADLIVALGGGTGARAITASDLYRKGFAPRVVATGPEDYDPRVRDIYVSWRKAVLLARGVPEKSLVLSLANSSWEEAVNILAFMRKEKLDHVLVVSDPPHLRRLAWVWGKVFEGSGKEFRLIAADMQGWDPQRWWQTSYSAQFVFGEYIKLVYYFAKY